MKLVIFDLDQTLVDFIAVHNEATRQLFNELQGLPVVFATGMNCGNLGKVPRRPVLLAQGNSRT